MSKKEEAVGERFYYDACVLDGKKSNYGELLRNKNPARGVTSHLAIGEAFGNSQKKGPEQLDAFLSLMESMSGYMEVVGNDSCVKVFKIIREKFPALSVTDGLHLATALHEKCSLLRTTDHDLHGIPTAKVTEIGKEFGIMQFSIVAPK